MTWDDNDLTDVTLVCDDTIQINAHKVILSASSEFFKTIFQKNKHSNLLLYLRGIDSKLLGTILDFIYHGEVTVKQEEVNRFLGVAQDLQLKGLDSENGV